MSVRFNRHVTMVSLEDFAIASTLTDEEKGATWYSPDEITAFRNNVRETSRRIRRRNRSTETTSQHKPQHDLLDDNMEDSRGLEHRLSPKRHRNKTLAMNIFMECQRRLRAASATTKVANSELQLAYIANKVSQWSRDLALTLGREDYIAAYPEMAPFVTAVMDLSNKRKSSLSLASSIIYEQSDSSSHLCSSLERRVRRRTVPISDNDMVTPATHPTTVFVH
mmetsp:Transcript_14081/g.18793  ORF Transcript_14081/g.18793 Transcript_14081/m.18793 type:complete len:223 (-) Transcript_14081:38-706(-)